MDDLLLEYLKEIKLHIWSRVRISKNVSDFLFRAYRGISFQTDIVWPGHQVISSFRGDETLSGPEYSVKYLYIYKVEDAADMGSYVVWWHPSLYKNILGSHFHWRNMYTIHDKCILKRTLNNYHLQWKNALNRLHVN